MSLPIIPSSELATDEIAGVHYQRVKLVHGSEYADCGTDNPLPVAIISGGGGASSGLTNTELRASPVAVSGTFYQTTQPVSIAAPVAVTGPLTDTQLRASAVPVSIASMPTTPVTGTFWPATQPISGSVSVTGSVAVTGSFYQATQPVSIASMPSTPVTGTFWQATQPVSGTVTANAGSGTFAVSGTFWQATQPVSGTVTVTQAALTKGSQGATGVSTQDLKDAGRVSVCIATVIGGVTAVATEALLSMVKVSDGVAAGGATTFAVTSGKRFRIQAIHVSARSTGATVLSGRFALRMNPGGAATASSPILAILSCTQQAAALAEAGDGQVLSIPDGLEISGTQQIGLTQVCSGTGGSVYATIIGYEY